MTTFCLPDLGEGLQEAEILNWHVSVGDHVSADQPLVSVETDKAVIEIPAPESGQIVKLFAEPGDIVQVGAPLLEYGTGQAEDTGAIVGELEKEETAPAAGRTEPRPKAAAGERPATAGLSAAPAVRRLAADLGVDLRTVEATGKHGEITATDVRNAAAAETGRLNGGSEELRGVRRAMAIRMHEAGREVVPASLHDDADLSAWKDTDQLLPRAVQALVHAARKEPSLNVWYDRASQTRTLFDVVNIGIAVDTADGLIVPVLKDAGAIPLQSLPAKLAGLVDDARNRTVKPDDLRGATITLSNYGALGGRYANLVVVPPQVAILGIGRASGTPRRLPLSLTMDHRAVSGGEAARFLSAFLGHIEAADQE
ncbi:MAG TPA: dihydrolipoamide acetyltransferase family protein [Afifellaceae bacterium]|nr:dihydrolipoamide acetyltransferase family protein [Afifellaceae bacterium]